MQFIMISSEFSIQTLSLTLSLKSDSRPHLCKCIFEFQCVQLTSWTHRCHCIQSIIKVVLWMLIENVLKILFVCHDINYCFSTNLNLFKVKGIVNDIWKLNFAWLAWRNVVFSIFHKTYVFSKVQEFNKLFSFEVILLL